MPTIYSQDNRESYLLERKYSLWEQREILKDALKTCMALAENPHWTNESKARIALTARAAFAKIEELK